MSTVFLALGTNLDDRLANLRAALAALPPEITVVARSRVYETPAWGYEDQPPFLNMVVKGQTDLPPEALLAHVKHLEAGLGRTPSFHWGPRLIDIDILFYDGLVLDSPSLIVPHPRLHERAFVLVPLADVAADLVHPVLHKTISQLVGEVDTSSIQPFRDGDLT